ncbi:hypothetical protein EJ02DRAFT_396773 [Clathrospora elynae]|uniref:Glycosyltransferase family 31 protein n=1 Tax=Clathrospora elynae TaxID=706981 RepID=A0A6A5SZJ9_9PLEO|nr:hypothetical protein EJ02DRAFT_396773 [Clathrospora elynae]
MPLFTPSRLAIIVVSFSLLTLFWTFGLPHRLAQPVLPIIDHYDHKNVHSESLIPPPVIEKTHATTTTTAPAPTAHGDRPAASDDHRWDDKTGIAEYEKDGGRWEDKDKLREGEKSRKTSDGTAIAAPTTLLARFCKDVRGAPHVMVVLRTSKAEVDKIFMQLLGLLSCVPHFAIFSDHAGEIEGHTIYNALDSIGSDAKSKHAEFHEYQMMLADSEHTPDAKKIKDLDKWKFLPMVYKAYHLNPSAKFVVFIEADTSLSWTNLLQWVDRLDYRIPYYSGAPAYIASTDLAQRGAGIMLSQGALRRYAKSYDELYTTKWEPRVGRDCCGDLILAKALNDAHVEFYKSWPLLQAERPNTLDYTRKHWCVPAVSWHHVNSADLAGLWELQKNWTHTHGWDKPYLFRDAFHDSVEPYIQARKEAWDNLSQDAKIVAPQGRQQQMKEEGHSKKHQEKQVMDKEEDKKQEGQKLQAKMKQQLQKESLYSHIADSNSKSHQSRNSKKEDVKEGVDWDRLAAKFKDAGDSAERCLKVCEQVEDCLQWRYTTKGDGECHLSKVLRLGGKEGVDKWTSGWLLDRVKVVTKEWECQKVEWDFYQ